MAWRVETLNVQVDQELAALPDDMRARLVRIGERVVILHVFAKKTQTTPARSRSLQAAPRRQDCYDHPRRIASQVAEERALSRGL